jgi:hypothetical protein
VQGLDYLWPTPYACMLMIQSYSNNRDLEIKMRSNQVCGTIRSLIARQEKMHQIKCYKAMVVPVLTYGSQIWTIKEKTNRKQKLKLQK